MNPSTPLEVLARRFVAFSRECQGSSPLYAALSLEIARDVELLELLASARPDQRVPNLLFAAVHAMLLSTHSHEPLAAAYPTVCAHSLGLSTPPKAAWPAFRAFCQEHREALGAVVRVRATQTNEVGRSALWLPVFAEVGRHFGAPFALVEVGCSAGLNLLFDRYGVTYDGNEVARRGPFDAAVQLRCAWSGGSSTAWVPPGALPLAERVGLDREPLDVSNPDDVLWLRALVWPEQVDRLARLDAAITIARQHPPRIVRGDALHDLESLVAELPTGRPVCVFHSAVLTYFTPEERTAFAAVLARITAQRPILWASIESRGVVEPLAALCTTEEAARRPRTGLVGLVEPGRGAHLIGLADLHGAWIDVLGRRTG